MRRGRLFFASMVAVASAGAGCSGPSTTGGDAGADAADQDAGRDAGSGLAAVRVCVGDGCPRSGPSASTPADFACRGVRAAPSPGAPVTAAVRLDVWDPRYGPRPIPTPSPYDLGDRPLALFPGTELRGSCDGDCVMATTDATGTATVTLPAGGWFGYRLPGWGSHEGATTTVLGYFSTFPSTAGESATVTAVGTVGVGLVLSGLNRELTDESSVVGGVVTDCEGVPVANVGLRMFRGSEEICPGGCPVDDTGMPRVTGLADTTIPSPAPDGRTGYAGRFAGIVAAAGGLVRIEAYGALEEGAAPVLLACEEVLVEGNTVTVAVVPPLRDDYPAGHGCAGRR